MNMDFKTYYSKVKGCYLGKNIGGTLGAPFECYRGVYDLDGFMQDVSNPVPNDDVDLQLVWLSAAEHEGRRIDSCVLAEYWNTFVSSVISEYGTGKNNFNMGILPPLSGHMRNVNKDSNGAWIRTEIWACLCAGNPALAANYAYYDACVDHSGEGVIAAVFIAAMESAAFFEKDTDKLLDIGLSYIPAVCGVRTAVELVRDCYKKGEDWKKVRIKLFKTVPSSFGEMGGPWRGTSEVPACTRCPSQENDPQIPSAIHGYDAPWSIGAIVLGWLYGGGDFGKSVCLAVNCGEDTDCTAGTLGAILGILLGEERIPVKWSQGCSDKIAICTLRPDALLNAPKTIGELCGRIVKQTPVFLENRCIMLADGSYEIEPIGRFYYGGKMFDDYKQEDFAEVFACGYDTVRKKFRQYTVLIKFDEDLSMITEDKLKKLRITILNQRFTPQYLTVKLHGVPLEWEVPGGTERCLGLEHWHGGYNDNGFELKLIPRGLKKGKYDFILELSDNGKFDKNFIAFSLLNGI